LARAIAHLRGEFRKVGLSGNPSIGKERVSTVAKPELKFAVIISGIFSYINSILYARNTGKNTQNMIDNGKIGVGTKMLMYTVFYSN
jgi:hypothetical protein